MKRRPPTTRWLKDIATWKIGKTLYISVVFSWDVERSVEIAAKHNGPVIVGGPAAILNQGAFEGVAKVQEECDVCEPVLFHNPLASFSTRGCPNKCHFCIAHRVEGEFRELTDFRPAPIMCDNNFLAASEKHQKRVVDAVKHFPLVDFYGLDAQFFTPEAADNLGRLNLHARFAFDSLGYESKVADAITLCKKRTSKHISIYALVGFRETPEETLYRLRKIIEWGTIPVPMRYQPLDAKQKNEFVADGWTGKELRRMTRYFWKYRFLSKTPYEEYDPPSTARTLF